MQKNTNTGELKSIYKGKVLNKLSRITILNLFNVAYCEDKTGIWYSLYNNYKYVLKKSLFSYYIKVAINDQHQLTYLAVMPVRLKNISIRTSTVITLCCIGTVMGTSSIVSETLIDICNNSTTN